MSHETTNKVTDVIAENRKVMPAEVLVFIDECLAKEHPKSELISVLQKVQNHFGYLPEEQLRAVSQIMQIPLARVTGVATFYHLFSLEKKGKFVINICMGTACYVNGAEQVANRFMEELGIKFGETTTDGLFSLESARCIGACGLAPVVMVGEEVHPQVTPDQVPAIIDTYIKKI